MKNILLLMTWLLLATYAQAMTLEQNRDLTITHTCLSVNSALNDLNGIVYWADSLEEILREYEPTGREVSKAIDASNKTINTVNSMRRMERLKAVCDTRPVDYSQLLQL